MRRLAVLLILIPLTSACNWGDVWNRWICNNDIDPNRPKPEFCAGEPQYLPSAPFVLGGHPGLV